MAQASDDLKARRKAKPEFRNINVFKDVPTYRLPLAGIVSILHRVSGLLMLVLLPLIVWLFEHSVTSQISFGQFQAALAWAPVAGLPILKVIVVALFWAFAHHLFAGIRHIYIDVSHQLSKDMGRKTALAVLIPSVALTLAFAAKLFGLF
jgi:succinate dehydrogenase / fumarate reductase cytochrome b subunit